MRQPRAGVELFGEGAHQADAWACLLIGCLRGVVGLKVLLMGDQRVGERHEVGQCSASGGVVVLMLS